MCGSTADVPFVRHIRPGGFSGLSCFCLCFFFYQIFPSSPRGTGCTRSVSLADPSGTRPATSTASTAVHCSLSVFIRSWTHAAAASREWWALRESRIDRQVGTWPLQASNQGRPIYSFSSHRRCPVDFVESQLITNQCHLDHKNFLRASSSLISLNRRRVSVQPSRPPPSAPALFHVLPVYIIRSTAGSNHLLHTDDGGVHCCTHRRHVFSFCAAE